ncbi:MECDP-synthase [Thermoanaerobacter ethanolicus JW 200]|nr:MECDP-synthase [Thermoanaerobacter ethanolicus JW 200]
MVEVRVGLGYDVHKFEKGRKLILGGVEIPMIKVWQAILMQMF